MTKVGLHAIGKSTTLESNKSLRQNEFDYALVHHKADSDEAALSMPTLTAHRDRRL